MPPQRDIYGTEGIIVDCGATVLALIHIQLAVIQAYPLIPPAVIPSTKYFCALKNRIVPGNKESTDIAST